MKSDRVVLHIGTGKAGSSALQKFFADNRSLLADSGYLYPKANSLKGAHHAYGHLWGEGYMTKERTSQFDAKELWSTLEQEVDASGLNVLMSTESWTLAFARVPASMHEVKAAFGNRKITIIVYLRAQDSHAESWYNQHVKSGYPLNDVNDLDQLPFFYDYYSLLSKMSGVFGKENIVVRPYERSNFYGGTIFSDFINAMGLDWSEEFILPRRQVNPSLTKPVLDFLLETNKIPRPISELRQFNRFILNNFCDQDVDAPAEILGRETRRKIVERYAEGNAKVAREFLGRVDGKLFYEESDKALPAGSSEQKQPTHIEMSIKIWEKLRPVAPA